MKIGMVIPTFWTREGGAFRSGDQAYDHPTPLDCDGTLGRVLESMKGLRDTDFELVVLACSAVKSLRRRVENRVDGILQDSDLPVKTTLFSYSHLSRFSRETRNHGGSGFLDFLSLDGYSNVRNMCLALPHLMGKDTAMLIDDDMLFSNPGHIGMARESLEKTVSGRRVAGLAGYYTLNGKWESKLKKYPWKRHFDRERLMNEVLKMLVRGTKKPELVPTFFALGGNLVLTRDIFMDVHFDQKIERGEDMDFAMNAMMLGKTIYFHNRMNLEHHPPDSRQPAWLVMRRSIRRFIYQARKLRSQKPGAGMKLVRARDLGPYPGTCLSKDFPGKLVKANEALRAYYQRHGNAAGEREAKVNIALISDLLKERGDPFQNYMMKNDKWKEFMRFLERPPLREAFQRIIS